MNPSAASQCAGAVPPLPPELLYTVAFFLDTHRDLLSFALACRTFKEIAIPRHLEYRVVRCNIRCFDVWRHLAERPDLARGVRSIEVVDNEVKAPLTGPQRVPGAVFFPNGSLDPDVTNLPFGEVLLQLSKALRHMGLLREFSMTTTKASDLASEAPVWDILCQCSSLRHVKRLYPRCRSSSPPVTPQFPLWSLRYLTSFTFANDHHLLPKDASKFLTSVLRNSPALEHLEVSVRHRLFRLADFFSSCRLPHLRTLSLEINRYDSANGNALSRFLLRTPSIERLRTRGIYPDPLRSGSLPALTHLSVEWSHRSPAPPALIADPTLHAPRKMHTLGWVRIDIQGLQVLRQLDGNALRSLEIVYFESLELLKDAVRMFPKLERLRVPHRDYTYDWHGVTLGPIHTASWGELLLILPRLQVFRGASLFRDPGWSNVADNDDRACELAEVCPYIRVVEHWDLENEKAIIIERGESVEDTRWRVEKVPEEWEWSNVA